MSAKNRDGYQRWRSKTVAVRMSPEEAEVLDRQVRLSGLTKQEYVIQCLLKHEVIVYGNPRVFKGLKDRMELILEELQRIREVGQADDVLLRTIDRVAETCLVMREMDGNI